MSRHEQRASSWKSCCKSGCDEDFRFEISTKSDFFLWEYSLCVYSVSIHWLQMHNKHINQVRASCKAEKVEIETEAVNLQWKFAYNTRQGKTRHGKTRQGQGRHGKTK